MSSLKEKQTDLLIKLEILDILRSLTYSGCCSFSISSSSFFQIDDPFINKALESFKKIHKNISKLDTSISDKMSDLTDELVEIKTKIDSLEGSPKEV
jgi:hypothetical protein